MDLSAILKKEFLELNVDIISIPGTSNIEFEELTNAVQYIKNNKLIQDAEALLTGVEPMRSSVTYPIHFPNQERELNFKVDWIQGPMVYKGCIQTKNHVGDDVPVVRIYGMRIKPES